MKYNRHRLLNAVLVGLLVGSLGYLPKIARAEVKHGPTGTLNDDYFSAQKDPHLKWLSTVDTVNNHINPAVKYIALGDLKRAKNELDFVLARFVNHPQALALAGTVSKISKEFRWGNEHFLRALALYPQYAMTRAQYGKFLVDIGQIDAGIRELNAAIDMDPKFVLTYEWLAAAYLKIDKPQLARDIVERSKELSNDR